MTQKFLSGAAPPKTIPGSIRETRQQKLSLEAGALK